MKKFIITALLLCTALFVVGCKKKEHSVEDFKKDQTLLDKWVKKCETAEASVKSSQNCQNAQTAASELMLQERDEGFNESDSKPVESEEQ
ncbi:putative DNA-binding WGR domain protein [Bartonella silvatica]|uniref:DNA-binding WGR domain protein n=1 Tax=Bartonella silvatica TaxID=357760 RepID=A0ABV2HGR2_9HYPH